MRVKMVSKYFLNVRIVRRRKIVDSKLVSTFIYRVIHNTRSNDRILTSKYEDWRNMDLSKMLIINNF